MWSGGAILAAMLAPVGVIRALGWHRDIDWRYLLHGALGITAFAAFAALGLKAVMVMTSIASAPKAGIAIAAAFAAWIAVGALRMLRAASKLRKPSAWPMEAWTALDLTLIGVAVGFSLYAIAA